MSTAFNHFNTTEPTHKTVYYEHPAKPIGETDGIAMSNYQTTDIAAALAFLVSGETVVTSSYHGALWAHWLGRKVRLAGPYAKELAPVLDTPSLAAAHALTRQTYHSLHADLQHTPARTPEYDLAHQ
jgi:hypothetical protein